jgi:hypothetical protein
MFHHFPLNSLPSHHGLVPQPAEKKEEANVGGFSDLSFP